jgi:hypothetical protein
MKTKKILYIVFFFYSLNVFSQNIVYQPAEKYFNQIIVEKSNFDFKNDKEFNKRIEYIDGLELMNDFGSWEKFPTNYKMFDSVSVENVDDNWTKYKDKIIELSKNRNLDYISLTKCLEMIKEHRTEIALLPIAAYQCKNRKHDVWIIVCLWEYKDSINIIPNSGYPKYGHRREFAIDVTNFEIIAFRTCG